MANYDSADQSQRSRFRFGLRTLLAVAIISPLLIWFLVDALWSPPKYRNWEQIREDHAGFDVVQEPASAGPYIHIGSQAAGRGEVVDGAVTWNGETTPYYVPADPDAELRVVLLVPKNESTPTYAIFRLPVR